MGALWAVLTSLWAFYTWHAERELRRQAPEAFLGKIVLHLNGESMIHTDANGTRHIITAYKDTHHGR